MKDLFALFDKIFKNRPDVDIYYLLFFCFSIIVVWKMFEAAIPKIIDIIFSKSNKNRDKRKQHALTEQTIRDFISRHLSTNWISSVPSLAEYNFFAPLEDIFVPIYVDMGQRKGISINDAISANNALLIMGQPGCGKSTLISMLAISYAKNITEDIFGFIEARLPIFIELKKIKNEPPSLPNAISDYFCEIGLSINPDFLSEQLENGRCVIFLDGLDECGDQLRRSIVVDWIIKAKSAYGLNRWIITSRNTSNDILKIPSIPKAEIRELSMQQIQLILKKWSNLKDRPQVNSYSNDELINLVFKNKDYLSLQPFLNNPLMVTLIAIIYNEGYEIPKSRGKIIHLFINIMAKEWDGIKLLYPDLNTIRIKIMGKIALFIMSSDKSDSAIDIVEGNAQEMLAEISRIYKLFSIKEFFDYIVDRTGLMRRITDTKYEFVNRNFLECLAALEIINSNQFQQYVLKIHDEYWIATIEFCASFHKTPKSFIKILDKQSGIKERQYCKVLSSMYLGNEYFKKEDKLVDVVFEKIRRVTHYLLKEGLRDKLTIRLSYYVLGDDLLEYLRKELISQKSKISIDTIVRWYVSIDTDKSIREYLEIINERRDSQSFEKLLSALSESKNHLSTKFLIELIEKNNSMKMEHAISALSSQGERIVPFCKAIIENASFSSHHQLKMLVAVSMLGYSYHLPYVIDKLGKFSLNDQLQIKKEFGNSTFDFYFIEAAIEKFHKSKKNIYINIIKPIMDKALAGLFLIMISPILVLSMLIIKLESKGPIFYNQERLGLRGKIFRVFKFRTMHLDAERSGAVWAMKSDPRITRIGSFLRRTRIDETPQLVNVLKGEMSLIGPRPERPYFHEELVKIIPYFENRLNVKPGITGLTQLNYPYGASAEDSRHKLYYDILYISKCGLLTDLKILFKTVLVGLFLKGSR